MAALELAKWEGKAEDFYFKFAGDPKRGGLVHIRETEEPTMAMLLLWTIKEEKKPCYASAKANITGPFLNGTTKVVFGRKQSSIEEYLLLLPSKMENLLTPLR